MVIRKQPASVKFGLLMCKYAIDFLSETGDVYLLFC